MVATVIAFALAVSSAGMADDIVLPDARTDLMVALRYQGQTLEGRPLAISPSRILLLGRDGRLFDLPSAAGADARQVGNVFRPFSPSEVRALLLRELGPGYEVSGAGAYMVAHPAGQRDRWPDRFDALYRAFVHYFTVRGIPIDPPPTPLIAVVCRDADEFFRHSAGRRVPVSAAVWGWYDAQSNRLMIYDRGGQTDYFTSTQAVLIHEATHQTAFNTGIHCRWSMPPRWTAEGLATLFEAPGVFDARQHARLSDRINRLRYDDFLRLCRGRNGAQWLHRLAADDRMFFEQPDRAYAAAWALTFYLTETMPAAYGRYLRQTASGRPWHQPSAEQRLAEFAMFFGDNWPLLAAKVERFIDELPR